MSEKLPPKSIEAEQGFLGCVLLGAADEAASLEPRVTEEWFTDVRNQKIWGVMVKMIIDN